MLKVKEPQPEELAYLRPGLVLFTYLHLAAYPDVADALLAHETVGVAYETVQLDSGGLPLLAPMSEVAGRMAPQVGAHFLERAQRRARRAARRRARRSSGRVVVIGAGNVGWNAAWIAQGMEAEVLLFDRNLDRLRWVDQIHKGRIMTLAEQPRLAVERAVAEADLVIGAVLVPGGRAPVVVTEEMVRSMRPGSVIVDCAIDQGGSSRASTRRHTTIRSSSPTACCTTPWATFPVRCRTRRPTRSTNATLPYLVALATLGVADAVRADPGTCERA